MVEILSPRDAGKLLGLTTARIQQLDRQGELLALRDSMGRRFYLPEEVERFKAQRDHTRLERSLTKGRLIP